MSEARDTAARAELHTLGIASRRKGNLSAPAAPSDFVLEKGSLGADAIKKLIFTPYAVDTASAQVLEVGMPAVPVKRPRAFFYLDQYEEAQALRSLPILEYAAVDPEQLGNGEGHVFVFSVGRAGSTLFSRILMTRGIVSISEPDVLLHLSQRKLVKMLPLASGDWPRVYANALLRLQAAHGGIGPFAIKYRAQSSNWYHVSQLRALFPAAHFVFLFRDPTQWSISFAKKFGFKAATMQWLFTENLKTCKALLNGGARVSVIDYDRMVSDPGAVLDKIAPDRGEATSDASLKSVMKEDSQHGLFEKPITTGVQEAEAFMAWWQQTRPAELLSRLGLPY